jgi:type I restriction enzyme R subunit
VQFATYQTLGIDANGDGSFLTDHYDENAFSVIIIDECHRSTNGCSKNQVASDSCRFIIWRVLTHVRIPSRAKQSCIVARLKAQLAEVDAIAQAAAAQLAEIERLPQGLLARAFPSHPQGISA